MDSALAANLIAGIALFFSIYTFYRQKSYSENQDKLNKLLLQKELLASANDKRAELGASFVRVGPKSSYRLKVWNKGKAPARNIYVEFPEGNNVVPESELTTKFPLESLEPQSGVELIAMAHHQVNPKHVVKIIWDDEGAQKNEKIFHLTL